MHFSHKYTAITNLGTYNYAIEVSSNYSTVFETGKVLELRPGGLKTLQDLLKKNKNISKKRLFSEIKLTHRFDEFFSGPHQTGPDRTRQ